MIGLVVYFHTNKLNPNPFRNGIKKSDETVSKKVAPVVAQYACCRYNKNSLNFLKRRPTVAIAID